jgi:hypothetical protein
LLAELLGLPVHDRLAHRVGRHPLIRTIQLNFQIGIFTAFSNRA